MTLAYFSFVGAAREADRLVAGIEPLTVEYERGVLRRLQLVLRLEHRSKVHYVNVASEVLVHWSVRPKTK